MRILSDGFAEYVENLYECWEDHSHHNGWLRIELRVSTAHASDWRELHFGYYLS
jgi:hypothetical protein